MMHKADDRVGMLSRICSDQRGVIQFILNQNIKIGWKFEFEIVCEMRGVIAPGPADDFNCVALCAQIFHQFAVVHISAAERVKRTVDYEADFHLG